MSKKRVWCLYRVSTKKQTSSEDDIPMQKTACHSYVKNKSDWEITNELYEKGISGWSKKTDDRDVLTEIKEAAIKRKFDILLVFMLDRLGRREDESPLVVKFLHDNEIEVWSVQEGKRSVESHVDKLITYIGFWQSSGESLKTSIRVRESKKQLSEQGYYQGGVAPYGYKIIETGVKHWKVKDRYLKELIPDEYESEVVKLVFNLYVNHHCGYRKIIDKLSELGYKARGEIPFRVNTVQRILTNTICIGLKNYKSHDSETETQPYNEKLRIVSDELFYKAEEIRTKRKSALNEQDKEGIPLSGKLMFSGLSYCSYCGAKLSGNYLYRDNKVIDKTSGKEYNYRLIVYRYRCPMNKGKNAEKHEQSMWGAKKFDKIIIGQVKAIMGIIDIEKFIEVNVNKKKSQVEGKKKNLISLQKDKDKLGKQLDKLNGEIANSLLGNSAFTPDQLSTAISTITLQINEIDDKIKIINSEIGKQENNYFTERNLAEEIKDWEVKFDEADDDLKKAMLSRIIERVEFHKTDVNIDYKFQIKELIKMAMLGAN